MAWLTEFHRQQEDIGGYLPLCCCNNSQRVHQGFHAGGKNHKRSVWSDGNYGEFSREGRYIIKLIPQVLTCSQNSYGSQKF
jgi:hypothetical protein